MLFLLVTLACRDNIVHPRGIVLTWSVLNLVGCMCLNLKEEGLNLFLIFSVSGGQLSSIYDRLYVEVSCSSSNDKNLLDLIRILGSEQSDSPPAGIDAFFFHTHSHHNGSLTMLWEWSCCCSFLSDSRRFALHDRRQKILSRITRFYVFPSVAACSLFYVSALWEILSSFLLCH